MKKLLITFILIVTGIISSQAGEIPAKDVLVLKNGSVIECLIQEITNSQVKYYKLNLPEGPAFVESTDNIVAIMYRDGSVQTYEQSAISETPKNDSSMAQQQNDSLSKNAFQCNLELGAQFTSNNVSILEENYKIPSGGVDFDLSFGARITKLAFVGVGFGIHGEFIDTSIKVSGQNVAIKATSVTIPIYLDGRIYVPTKVDASPFFLAAIGASVALPEKGKVSDISVYNQQSKGRFFMQLGLGFEAKRFQMSMGYRMHAGLGDIGNYGFIKIGARFGKNVAPYKKL